MISRKPSSARDAERLFLEAERHEERGELKCAFECLLAAARIGDSSCQVNLGNFYSAGKGVRKNLKKAAYWYRLAYKNGERSGAHNLAIDYWNLGNSRLAISWFKKAIAMGDGEACFELAKVYRDRRGGLKLAIHLLREALLLSPHDISELGREEAEALLEEITVGDVKAAPSGMRQ